MKRAIRYAMVAAAMATVVVVLTPSAAQAQVRVEGRFRLPHGEIAIGVGDPYSNIYYGAPAYPIGSYVPYGYRVIEDPRFGYGFHSPAFVCRLHHVRHRHWIPVRRYSRRWIVIERPYFGGRAYRRDHYGRRYDDRYLGQGYRGDPYYDFNREYWDRSYHPYDDPNYGRRPYPDR